MSHTPGKWALENVCSRDGITTQNIRGKGGTIACTLFGNVGESECSANAQLIASAPEMLKALESCAELIKTARRYYPKSIRNSDTFDLELTCATINTAIHLARG